MRPKKSLALSNSDVQPNLSTRRSIDFIKQYELPVYRQNRAGSYIEFRAYDPELGRMRRKTIKLNHIEGNKNRRDYAHGVIKRLNNQLRRVYQKGFFVGNVGTCGLCVRW